MIVEVFFFLNSACEQLSRSIFNKFALQIVVQTTNLLVCFASFLFCVLFSHLCCLSSLSSPLTFLVREEVVVEYKYDAHHDDELTLHPGDIIKNVRYIDEDGWMEGELNGKRGLFPDNFVKVRRKIFSYLFGNL